jgi:hypothetical protein
VWKTDTQQLTPYNKIMVVGIIKEEDDSLRSQVESQMVDQLTALGYYAVSSLKEFGRYGLSNIGEEGTYLKLCDNGIDAVLTLALIDQANKSYDKKGLNTKYTYTYYYNRIWNYRKIQNDTGNSPVVHRYRWESILFDLGSLQPQCVMQVKTPLDISSQHTAAVLSGYIISQMVNEKIIKKQKPLPVVPKPF